jgi:type I restriction-modification system DNA methylase subunit
MSYDKSLNDFGPESFKTTGHATESTISELFTEELGKKVKVLTQLSYQQLSGRKQPDATIGEKQDYFIEAEWEGNETKGLVQAARYQRLGGKGVFVVMFPNRLRRSMPRSVLIRQAKSARFSGIGIFNDQRNEDFFSGRLDELMEWISDHVLREIPVKEVKTSQVIAIIQKAVDYISATLVGITEQSLDEIFGGKSVFDNILQFEEKKYPLKEMRKGAAYLLVNQILFYHLLSKARPDDFEELEEERILSFEALQGYFDKVLKIDYRPTFGFKIATKLPKDALDPVRETVNIIKALRPEKLQHDILGKIFHKLIPFEVRKAVAAFYTNNEAGALLARLAIHKATDKIIDLACGSGTLLVSAYHRKKELMEAEGKTFTPQDHKRFLEKDLTGIDIMPFAAHLAAVHLSLQEPLYETQRVRLAVWDSTEPTVRPGKVIPTISRELRKAYARPKLDMFSNQSAASGFQENAYVKKGALTPEGIGGDAISLESVDVVIMNPPFTRQERLPDENKKKLTERFKHYSDVLTGQMGLHGYFVLLADIFLEDGGRLAFVLPATVLRLQSMEGIRKFLVENYRLDYVVTTEQRSAFSEAARFREILLVATKTKKDLDSSKCLFVNLKRIPVDAADSDFLADEMASSKNTNQEVDDADLSTSFVAQSELRVSNENWFSRITSEEEESLLDFCSQQASDKLKTFQAVLDDAKGKIVRGIEHWTDKPVSVSSAFILSSKQHAIKKDDRWVLKETRTDSVLARDRFVETEVTVPKKAIIPALRRPSGLRSIDVSDEVDYAVVSRFAEDHNFFVKGLVDKGKNLSYYVKKWRQYLESRKANLVVSRRFNLSAPNTAAMAFFSSKMVSPCKMLWAIQGLKDEDAKILALWFNSTINISQILSRRAETEGAFMGLDQYILQQFLVVDPSKLGQQQKKRLIQLFDEHAKTQLPSVLEQFTKQNPVRKAIDLAILEALGIKGNLEELLGSAYENVSKTIRTLATLMKEGEVHSESEP